MPPTQIPSCTTGGIFASSRAIGASFASFAVSYRSTVLLTMLIPAASVLRPFARTCMVQTTHSSSSRKGKVEPVQGDVLPIGKAAGGAKSAGRGPCRCPEERSRVQKGKGKRHERLAREIGRFVDCRPFTVTEADTVARNHTGCSAYAVAPLCHKAVLPASLDRRPSSDMPRHSRDSSRSLHAKRTRVHRTSAAALRSHPPLA